MTQLRHRLFRNRLNWLVDTLRIGVNEMAHQKWYVPNSVSQRGYLTGKNFQVEAQISEKFLPRSHLRQGPVGCGPQPHIGTKGPRASQPFEFLFLQHPK